MVLQQAMGLADPDATACLQGNNAEEPPRQKCSAPSKVIGTKLVFLQTRNAKWLLICDQQGSQKMEEFLNCVTKLWFLKYEDLPFKKDLDIDKPNPHLSLLDTPQQLSDTEHVRFKAHRKRISQWFCNHNSKLLKTNMNEAILDLIYRAHGAESATAPWKKQAAQLFLQEYHTKVYAIFTGQWEEELAKAKAASKKPPKKVTILMKVTQELLAEQPESFCAEVDQMVLDDYCERVKKWESQGKGSYVCHGNSPEEYDQALFDSGNYM
ncbi:hypothetical protein JAAARDRAFT_197847 [Jaapia argillacea MUCL 33604]|uniref:Uncharacterized protein n=1 Tax=Jaapia argillacea MUCL 33604 TaxID=933084 RepID=A0A067PE81_9AGAM|nr:hypothetical protein JAAARDRAFT_197847 [Jaapia argillacea MUCL 33604]